MDSRAAVVASAWFAVAIISAMYLYVGGITLTTNIVVGLLVVLAFIVTFAVTFGLEGMRQESPQAKAKVQMSAELTEIKATVSELARKVDAIKKELED
jgi:fatty acid desaturase